MEIRILQIEELANAAGLSRFVFDNCVRNRMEFVQTAAFVEEYLSLDNLTAMCQEQKLTIWAAFEMGQMVGVSGLQSDGMITMLYILPQYARRGFGSALLSTMREFAKDVYGFEQVTVNATPAWASTYFASQGFVFRDPKQNMHVPYVTMDAFSNKIQMFKKNYVSGKFIGITVVVCFLLATIIGCAYMAHYLF